MAKQVRATTEPSGARAGCTRHGLAAELGDSLVVVFAHEVSRLGGEVHDYEEVLRERGRAVLEEARSVVARPASRSSSSCASSPRPRR